MSFPVDFAMNFTERLSIYVLVGSQPCPDAESLIIPLMRMQFIGMPFRNHVDEDWMFMTWQNLDDVRLPSFIGMPGCYFLLVSTEFFITIVR